MNKGNRVQTTKKGFQKLMEELKHREENVRRHIANTLNEMRNQGDLRENDGYSMAVEEQQINEERILELKDRIRNVEVVKETGNGVVGMGSVVTLENGKKLKYEITSEDDSNPLERKISITSPLGEAISGKKVGQEVTITTPMGDTKYKIVAID